MPVQDNVTISHRGSRYEIGRGPGFYGIWRVDAADEQQSQEPRHPIEWWSENPQGWQDAWERFTGIEKSSDIAEVSPPLPEMPAGELAALGAGGAGLAGAGSTGDRIPSPLARLVPPTLLMFGVLLGLIGLFPSYLAGQSLTAQASQYLPHLIYLAGWVAGAVLLFRGRLRGGSLARGGALLALGTSAVTFGLLLADFGQVVAGGYHLIGAGLVLSLLGWLVCTLASVVAVIVWRAGAPGRPLDREASLAAGLTAVAGLGAAIAFAPAWDSYTLTTPGGFYRYLTAGYAFSNPWALILSDVIVMIMLVAVVVLASLWQPIKLGAALLAGAVIPMVAQAVSAIAQLLAGTSPAQLGISNRAAAQVGLTITSGFTPAFWLFCAFVLALVLTCFRMLTAPEPAPPAPSYVPAADSAHGTQTENLASA
jgi:hypothetical protein